MNYGMILSMTQYDRVKQIHFNPLITTVLKDLPIHLGISPYLEAIVDLVLAFMSIERIKIVI